MYSQIISKLYIFKLIVYGHPLEIGRTVRTRVAEEKKYLLEQSFNNPFSGANTVKAKIKNLKNAMTLHVQVSLL